MNVEQWIAIATGGAAVIGWFVRIERRFGSHLTREEHERICQERNTRVERSIDELREDMDQRHAENRETHAETRETLSEIRDAVTGVHVRMDTLYRDLMQRGGR